MYRIVEIWRKKKKYYPQYYFHLFWVFPIWCYFIDKGLVRKNFLQYEEAKKYIQKLKWKETIKTYYP